MVSVKVGKTDWQVDDISFADRRQLHMMNALCFSGGEIDQKAYYEMLEKTRTLAGYGEGTTNEEKLAEHTMVEIDSIIQAWLMEYLGIGSRKKK